MNKKTVSIGAAIIIIVFGILWGVSNFWTLGKSHDVLVASGHPEWPPIMFQDGTEIKGAGPALVKKIFDEIGVKTEFPYSGTWDDVQAKAKSGDVDVLVAAYKTDERETYMDYSEAYTTDPVVLFVKTGKTFPFNSWEDLKSKRGVAMTGDSYGQAFDDFSATNLFLERVATAKTAFDMLTRENADYFIYSLYAGDDQMKKQNTVSQFESLPKFVNEENFYITVSKKSPFVKYMPQVNDLIKKYKADGTIDALIKQYAN